MTMNTQHGGIEPADFCFFEDDLERNFYDTPAPSMDIWKKFELLPTPPRSPSRDTGSALSPYAEDRLQLVSEYINEDDPLSQTSVFSDLIRDVFDEDFCPADTASLSSFDAASSDSILYSDCMWSVSVKEELKSATSTAGTTTNSVSSSPSVATPSVDIECVDPTAVFPYPSMSEQAAGPATPSIHPVRASSGMTHMAREHSYSSLGTETPSDSEEEIDVVTVDKDKYTVCTKRKSNTNSSSPNTTVVTLQPQSKHLLISKSSSLSQVALSLKRPIRSISTPNSPQSSHHPSKRLKRESSHPELKSLTKHKMHHRTMHNTSDGDSEDSDGKRTQHNVLERKRRNDLKYSFLTLRDHVPELHAQERAPKVTILKMAAEHIHALSREEKTLASEVERQRTRREHLQRRVEALRRVLGR